jgi:hypothetical protein
MRALELLIEKYEKAKQSQIDLKKETPLTYAAQHQLLDQNIHLFEGMIEGLRGLGNVGASDGKLPLCGVSNSLPKTWYEVRCKAKDLTGEGFKVWWNRNFLGL